MTDLAQKLEADADAVENGVATVVHNAAAFFEGIVAKGGASSAAEGAAVAAAASNASSQLKAAATTAEAAVEPLIIVAVNFVLGLIPGGPMFEPLVDAFIDQVVAALLAKKSSANR